MTCDAADLLLAAAAVDALDEGEGAGLRRHLRACARCREAAAAYRATADALALSVVPVEPSPALRSRLLAVVHEEAADRRRQQSVPGRLRRLWQSVPTGRVPTLAGFGAAIVAAAAAVTLAVHRPAPTPAAGLATVVRACGLTSAPDACGTLTVHPGTGSDEAVLTATGLEPTPAVGGHPDATYEVWLIDASHTPRPAAYLEQQPDGTWRAAMDGDMHGVVAVALTREPYGGSSAPSGTEVLRLTLPASA